MLSKEARDAIRVDVEQGEYGNNLQAMRDLLDSVDEAERALSARIQAIDLRPGDALVFKIEGLTRAVIAEPDGTGMRRVQRFVRILLDAAGLPDVKALAVDRDIDLAVLRATDAAVGLESRVADLEGESERRRGYEMEQRERR